MISITISNSTLILGAHTIFRDLNWEIEHDQKIGLIGPNGAGKSSLFKLIVGEHTPEFDPERTAISLALEGNPRVAEVEADLHRVESKLGDPEVYGEPKKLEHVLDEQHKLLEEFESLGGANYDSRVREMLHGLGLPESDFEIPIRALSGGQKKLIGLTRLMLAKPSVLMRLILGKEQPTSGEIKIGPSVKIGYYAQEHETLDFNQTVLDAVRFGGNMSESNAVSFLIRYLFTYQQATQKIGSLSGGERSRLQLALLVLSDANFLLLDEPTNNLDIASAEVLENALADFNGTVLVISHDRYFLDRTVHRIFELKDSKIAEYTGGYSDYAERANPSTE